MTDGPLTPAEVARRLGVTTRTVQRWIVDGRLPATRVGGRLRIAPGALGNLVDAAPPPRRSVSRPLRSLLIANRGEIAERIARTAQRLGLRVVGIHAADERPPDRADQAVVVPGYLEIAAIVEAARHSGADAVHPGYGFLAENAAFAAAIEAAGLTWVGPPAAAIEAMGDKARARRVAAAASVPVAPGYDSAAQDDATLHAAAEQIGYPLIVKPAAGGGGKGMAVVRAAGELGEALAAARRQSLAAFGDDALILERYLTGARHVEIQVLFDALGNGIHLGERDCSAQRRSQKIVEESPGPAVDRQLRERMGAAALAVARAVGYVNAGTVEFLVADDGAFYFSEMNTRLQVEHPVTELVTGRDLVADQLQIAAGAPLPIGQEELRIDGHAIEVRLYAEDPEAGFLPATGRLLDVRWPNGLRVDAGVRIGDRITDRYDPMLAKLIAHGPDRSTALECLRAALRETRVLGVRTNLRFLRWLLDQPFMRGGETRTDTLSSVPLPGPPDPSDAAWRTAATALLDGRTGVWEDGWRLNAAPTVRVRGPGVERRVEPAPGGVDVPAVREGDTVHVDVEGQSLEFHLAPAPSIEEAVRHAAVDGDRAALRAPMPGRIIALHGAAGDRVAAHAVLVVLEAMKMEHAVATPLAGTIAAVHVALGAQVQRGDLLLEVAAQ